MNKQDIIISLLKEIDKNIDNVNDSGGTNANLKELTVTANGEYLPADHDADGFSKVTAYFDTSSLGKVKVAVIQLNDNCINDNGIWEGELVSFNKITSMAQFCFGCNKVKNFDNIFWDFPENSGSWDFSFHGSRNLVSLDFSNANKTKVTSLHQFCTNYMLSLEKLEGLSNLDTSNCTNFNPAISAEKLKVVDITSWDFSNATSVNMFSNCYALTSFIGNREIEEVEQQDIKAFTNVKVSLTVGSSLIGVYALERPSLRAAINGLADVNDKPAESRPTLNLGATLLAKLTDGDKVIATEKGWNLA